MKKFKDLVKENDLGLGISRRATKAETDDIINHLNDKVTSYNFDGKKFDNLLDIYTYAKKNKITTGDITNKVGTWGKISNLLSKTKKEIIDYYI